MLSPLKVPGESIMFWGILGCDAPQAQGKQAGKRLSGSGFRIQSFCTISGFPLQERAGRGRRDCALLGLRCSCGQSLAQNVIGEGDKMKEKAEKKKEKRKKANRIDRCKKHMQKHHSPGLPGPPSGLTTNPVLTCTKEPCWHSVPKEKWSRLGVWLSGGVLT